jgi:predicted PurR-regulated permease PerM
MRDRQAAQSHQRAEERLAERFSEQLSRHWTGLRAEMRADRRALPDIKSGPSDFRSGRVPYGVDLAAAWSWRFLVIVAAGFVVAQALGFLMVVVMPVILALFIAALVIPIVDLLARSMPRGIAALIVVFAVIGAIALMLTFATKQVVNGADDLAKQVVSGLDEIERWLKDGPLNASDQQIDDAINGLQDLVSTGNKELVKRVTEVGTIIGHVVAGFFIVLFSTYFFLADGDRIWTWVVRIFPRAARTKTDSSGRVAWASLTQFVRATVLVALVDATGIAIVAAILDVPFVAAIAVLVFLGSFVPMIGATISGTVAVLVALVDQGPIVALFMLAGVIGVQQLEAHVLQPFLMGRFVGIHPLGVILSIAVGVLVAGIPGALVAVPLAATVNAVANHLSEGRNEPTEEEFPLGDVPEEPSPA